MEPVQIKDPRDVYGPIVGNRWIQLVCGVLSMIVISNFQYAFTLFTKGMQATWPDTPYKDIALIYTLFILFETWPVPVAGWLIDKFGIRRLMIVGAIGIGIGWTLGGTVANTPQLQYVTYGIFCGVGAGIIYIATVANAVKWFPDKRGLAAGCTAAGFGGGSALTLIPIQATIDAMGWQGAMTAWGIGQGIIACACAMILIHPPVGWVPSGWTPPKAVAQTRKQYTAKEMLSSKEFYIMYAMFLMVCTGGLMATGNMYRIAKSINVDNVFILGIAIVPFVATISGVTNALARIVWGSISDRIGREYTMAIAFFFEGVMIFAMTQMTSWPVGFMFMIPFVFLAWGEIYALFSAITADIFGSKNASGNYGILYTSKGMASIMAGWGAAAVAAAFGGSFMVPLYIAATFDIIAAAMGLFILRPIIRARIAGEAPSGH